MAASSRSRASSVRTCGSVMTFSCRRPPHCTADTRSTSGSVATAKRCLPSQGWLCCIAEAGQARRTFRACSGPRRPNLQSTPLHIPCPVIRTTSLPPIGERLGQASLLSTTCFVCRGLTYKELRLAYRLRAGVQKQNASKAELATIERAYNMLADPTSAAYMTADKRFGDSCSIPLLRFRISVGTGRRSAESGAFFANRILPHAGAPAPYRPVPLRKLDYFEDYAILRDRHRKLEVLIDTSCCRSDGIHLEPVAPSHYRHRRNICRLHSHGPLSQTRRRVETNRMGNRAPQPNRAGMPEGLEEDILKARSTHTRFGQYWQQIDRLRATCKRFPRSEAN